MKPVITALILTLLTTTTLWSQSGEEVMALMMDGQKARTSAMDIQMTLTDKNGRTSSRRLQTLTREDDNGLMQTITVFMEPASIKNTRFLSVENSGRSDDQWIYLPSLRKVKRIASSEKDSAFMGSDFYYSDMEARDVDESVHTRMDDETLNGLNCWVVESVPRNPDDYSSSRTRTWIDKEHHLPLRVEYYSKRSNTLYKVLETENIRQVDGRWMTMETLMTTLESDHTTKLVILQAKFEIPLDPDYFTTTFLQTGRTK